MKIKKSRKYTGFYVSVIEKPCISNISLMFMKNSKNRKKYNGFVLPNVKIPNISIDLLKKSKKSNKNVGSPKIYTSKNPKLLKIFLKVLGFWDFLKIPALCFIHSLLNLSNNNIFLLASWIPVF